MTTRAQSRVMPLRDPLLAFVPLPFEHIFYPFGFPVQIKSNEKAVLHAAERSWGTSRKRFDEAQLEVRYLICNGPRKRAPAPVCRAQGNVLTMVADEHNYACSDLMRGFGSAWLTERTVDEVEYFRYTFLEGLVYGLLENVHLVALHAACVVRDGHAVLLAADSGMGKSSLAYACACRGWTYVSDDGTSLIRRGTGRTVIGNPRSFRFRPSAADLFPELRDHAVTGAQSPNRFRKGKPSFEVWTESLPRIQTAPEANVDHIVFLKREAQFKGSARLVPISRETALRRWLPGAWPTELPLYQQRSAAVERLLEAELFDMSYYDLDATVDLLEHLVDRGL
ncbi:MAG: aldolase [Bryobacteraceae bacterium]